MNTLQQLLENLVNTPDSPFYKVENNGVEVYNYRSASYTNFCQPAALEARGIAFKDGCCIARPPVKFFNWRENPFTDLTMEEILDQVDKVWIKADGSLITTLSTRINLVNSGFSDIDQVVKSKASLSSDQALAAFNWLSARGINPLRDGVSHSFEWIGPTNRVVVGYPDHKLVWLCARNINTGEWVDEPLEGIETCQEASVDDLVGFKDQTGIEGYVVRLKSGQLIKFKTDWYLERHRLKDDINSDKNLFAICMKEQTDDLKSLFVDDECSLARIRFFELQVGKWFTSVVIRVDRFYEEYKSEDRKTYAIAAKDILSDDDFFLAMEKYKGTITNRDDYAKLLVDKGFDRFEREGNLRSC